MSGEKTISVNKLADYLQEDNPRLAEPLLLYAMETGIARRLFGRIRDEEILAEYRAVIGICKERSILALDETERESLPWGYQKLLATWKSVEEKNKRVVRSKKMRLEKTLELMESRNVNNAQIYHALDLNPGNTNAYLKHGDVSKFSLENATKIMKYLYAL
jgi:hypothetical protein